MAQDPLHLLCVEPSFPGRLGFVADWLVRRRGYRCQFYYHRAEPPAAWPESVGRGLEPIRFNVAGVAREPAVPWWRGLERGLCYAYGAFEIIEAKRPRAVDLVLGRSCGLGSSLFAPVPMPRVPLVNLFDYFVHPHQHDLAGEAGPEMPVEYFHWRRAANAMDLLDLENGVIPWVPTQWQRSLFPVEYQPDFLVLHDGIDAVRYGGKGRGGVAPAERTRRVAGRRVPAGVKLLSFVARVPDQLRGFDRFVALADRVLRERSDVVCVVAGDGCVDRMLDVRHFGQDYASAVLAKQPPADPERLWRLGSLSRTELAELFQATSLHVVCSRPYPVARSVLEAMAAGCVVLAVDSEPVREVLAHGQNGLIAPADDLDAHVALALEVLDEPDRFRDLGAAAAEWVRSEFDRDVVLPRLAGRLQEWAGRPPRG